MSPSSVVYRIPLRIVFYPDGAELIAHCLEFDLLGSGETASEALEQLNHAIAMQVEHALAENEPNLLFNPAPKEFEQMFAAGEEVAEGQLRLEITVGSPAYRFEAPRLRRFSPQPSDLALA